MNQEAFERWKARLIRVEFSWERQFLHEAGHAGSCLVLLNHSADIVAMNYVDENGNRKKHAQFRFSPGPQSSAPEQVFEQAMITAAGGMAEAIFFGVPSEGMTRDLVIIRQFVECLLFPQDIRDAIEREANDDFPQTRVVLTEHRDAVARIRDVAYSEFQRLGLDRQDDFDRTVILPEAEVRRLFQDSR